MTDVFASTDSAEAVGKAVAEYLDRGWNIIPLRPGTKKPAFDTDELRPHLYERPARETVRGWYKEARFGGVGVVTGPTSGIVVLDVDGDEGKSFLKQHGHPPTPMVQTSKGLHLYFKDPGEIATSVRFAPELDLKSSGGYVAAPPTVGREWIIRPDECPLADLPEWVVERIRLRGPKAKFEWGGDIPNGERNQRLTSLAGKLRHVGLDPQSILSTLITENERRCKPPLVAAEVQKIAESVGRYEAGPPVGRNDFSGAVREWPKLDDAALQGLPGEIVRAIDPHTEADPVAVLVNVLVTFGNAAGRGAYVEVGADRHHLNTNVALVGKTASGRKGTSLSPVLNLMHAADAEWADNQVLGGLSSGEGLINAVRDPVVNEDEDGKVTVVDDGASDKRLMVVESEFAGVLKVMTREGNTLSTIVRQAWDGGKLATLTRNSPLKATDAHISLIAHVTMDELLKRLSEADTHGGFTNRIVWLLVRRSKALPFGGEWNKVNVGPLVNQLTGALAFARSAGPITWGASARSVWEAVYEELSGGKVGLVGAATSRAAPQALRLAALYACMDESRTIEREHLEAALALWDYAEESACYIFGTATGDPVVDKIMEALRESPKGLTRTMINNDLFGGHQKSERIANALSELKDAGLVRSEREPTKGRPVDRWFLA